MGNQVDIKLQNVQNQYGLVAEIESPTGGATAVHQPVFPWLGSSARRCEDTRPYPARVWACSRWTYHPVVMCYAHEPRHKYPEMGDMADPGNPGNAIFAHMRVIKSYWIAGIFGTLLILGCAAQYRRLNKILFCPTAAVPDRRAHAPRLSAEARR